jgi:hypothetical protein
MKYNVYSAVKGGQSDNNIKYADFQNLIIDLGFVFERQRGSHAIYYHDGVDEFMNIQPDGNKAKSYQVRQLRGIMLTHSL